jgi:hypothetical protein
MPDARLCPDCDEPLVFAFMDTAGVGGWKQGVGFNTTPDTFHYLCFPCNKAWKQREDGPLTPDVVGDLAFFSCRQDDCGATLTVLNWSPTPTDIELACGNGHRFRVVKGDGDALTLEAF